MRCKEIEDHVVVLGLDPINVRFKKGQEVLWFVSVKRHGNGQIGDVVVHNDQGHAFVFHDGGFLEGLEKCNFHLSGHLQGTVGSEYVKLDRYTCIRCPEYDVPGKEGT